MKSTKILILMALCVGLSSQAVQAAMSLPPLAGEKTISWDDPSYLPNNTTNKTYLFTALNSPQINGDQNAFKAVLGIPVAKTDFIKDDDTGAGTTNGGLFNVEKIGSPNVVKWSATYLPTYVALKFANLYTVFDTTTAIFSGGKWSDTLTIGEREPNPDSLSHGLAYGVIPEPSSMLVWLGMVGMGLARYRSRLRAQG